MANKKKKPDLVLARPVDRSLEAFKRWINNMVNKIMGDKPDDSMTEEDWIEKHKQFWDKVDEGQAKGDSNG